MRDTIFLSRLNMLYLYLDAVQQAETGPQENGPQAQAPQPKSLPDDNVRLRIAEARA